MAQFFSQAPIDLGANIIADSGRNLASIIMGAASKMKESRDAKDRTKMEFALQEDARKTEAERRLAEQAGPYGGPVIDAKTGQLDHIATSMRIMKGQRMEEQLRNVTGMRDRNNVDTEREAEALGVTGAGGGALPRVSGSFDGKMGTVGAPTAKLGLQDGGAPMEQTPAIGMAPPQSDSGGYAQSTAGMSLNRAVQLAKERKAAGDYQRQRETAASVAGAQKNQEISASQLREYRAATGHEPLPEHIDANGQISAAGLHAVKEASKNNSMTQTQKNAKYAVEMGLKTGNIKPDQADEAEAVFGQQLMGRAPALPQSERDQAVGNAKYINSLKALNKLVKGSVASGADDFGPIANRFKTVVGGMNGAYPTARAIDQVYKEAGATKAFGEGGKQLTNTEKDLTFGQIGAPTDNDFPARLDTHMERVIQQATLQLERLKASPHRFTADGQAAIGQLEKAIASIDGSDAAPTAPGQPAAAPASGFKILSVRKTK